MNRKEQDAQKVRDWAASQATPPTPAKGLTAEVVGKVIGSVVREEREEIDGVIANLRKDLVAQRDELDAQIAGLDENRLALGATADLAAQHLKAIRVHCENILLRKAKVLTGTPPAGLGGLFNE